MFELSVNIEYLFKEAGDDFFARLDAAKRAGFSKFEMFMHQGKDPKQVADWLNEHDCEIWTMVNDPRTILADSNNHQKFVDDFQQSLEFAKAIGCSRVVCGSGVGLPFIPREKSLQAAADAIEKVADIAKLCDVEILLESVNTRVDHPGVLFSKTEDSVTVASFVNHSHVKVLYDIYHSLIEGESVEEMLNYVQPYLGHIQIADIPGRVEPGAGNLDFNHLLGLIEQSGYRGVIGLECNSTLASSAEALSVIKETVKLQNNVK